jgi:hypothetical protein
VNFLLSRGRQAQIDLVLWDVVEAHADGNEELFRQRFDDLLVLRERLRLEQVAETERLRAELGYLPETFDGIVAVLAVAARILEVLGSDDGLA